MKGASVQNVSEKNLGKQLFGFILVSLAGFFLGGAFLFLLIAGLSLLSLTTVRITSTKIKLILGLSVFFLLGSGIGWLLYVGIALDGFEYLRQGIFMFHNSWLPIGSWLSML